MGHRRSNSLRSNNVREECISVTKLYDWVNLSNQECIDATVPVECREAIQEALEAGNVLCIDVLVPEVGHHGSEQSECRVLSLKRITVPNPCNDEAEIEGAVVRLLQMINLVVVVCDETTGTEICRFEVPVRVDDDVFVCLPGSLDERNVVCHLNSIEATTSGVIVEDLIQIDLCICQGVKVEADVILEVQGKFCTPRQPIAPPALSCECPKFVDYPEQCDFFPKRNCDCQGLLKHESAYPVNVVVNGMADQGVVCINAEICPNCSADASSVVVSYRSSANSQNDFTFIATNFNNPDCFLGTTSTLNISGFGTRVVTTNNASDNLGFDLTLTETEMGNTSLDTYSLDISGGATTFFSVTDVMVPDAALTITDCLRFPDPV